MVDKYKDDHSDISQNQRMSKILQPLSGELLAGPNRLNAQPGDILAYFDDNSLKVFPRVSGMPFISIYTFECVMEWPAQRDSRAPPIAMHDFVPADAAWVTVDASGRRACIRSSTGTKIEKTYLMYMLVEGRLIGFPFRSTAYQFGKNLANEVDRVIITIDDDDVRAIGAYYNLSSREEKTWHAPTCRRVARYGEPGGPPIDVMRQARDLRFEIKPRMERERKERLAALVRPTPKLTGPSTGSTGSTSFTSGIARWSDPKAGQANPPTRPEDDIPFA
jgi:hypothetical protein